MRRRTSSMMLVWSWGPTMSGQSSRWRSRAPRCAWRECCLCNLLQVGDHKLGVASLHVNIFRTLSLSDCSGAAALQCLTTFSDATPQVAYACSVIERSITGRSGGESKEPYRVPTAPMSDTPLHPGYSVPSNVKCAAMPP